MTKIIMYHYIQNFNKEFSDFNFLNLKNFYKQVDYLSKKSEFFKLDDKFKNQKKNNSIVLSFDDGLKNHLKIAEYLNKKNICGIFSIPTLQLIKKDFLNIHKLHLLFGKYSYKTLIYVFTKYSNEKYLTNLDKKNIFKYFSGQKNFYNQRKKNQEYRDKILLKTKINYYISKDKNIVNKMFNHFFDKKKQKKIFSNFYLNINDIKKISKLGMIISSHSHNHNNLNLLNKKEQFKDIKKSKMILENIISKKVKFFTYPYGGKGTYNKKTLSILRKLKIKYGISVDSKDFSIKNSNLEIPRYDCNLFKYGKVVKKNV
tara:strand:- start:7877 stop:8821 length:945 start_codon:yes stop_codon:yes gene_type:complete